MHINLKFLKVKDVNSHVGIEQARKVLGDLVNEVRYSGRSITLTRKGRPVARIAPLEERRMDTPFSPETPEAVIADAVEETAALVATEYMRRAEKAPTPEAKETAKAQMREIWRGKNRRGLDRAGMIGEFQRLHGLLDELESDRDDR